MTGPSQKLSSSEFLIQFTRWAWASFCPCPEHLMMKGNCLIQNKGIALIELKRHQQSPVIQKDKGFSWNHQQKLGEIH
jgi:hypothetical protein